MEAVESGLLDKLLLLVRCAGWPQAGAKAGTCNMTKHYVPTGEAGPPSPQQVMKKAGRCDAEKDTGAPSSCRAIFRHLLELPGQDLSLLYQIIWQSNNICDMTGFRGLYFQLPFLLLSQASIVHPAQPMLRPDSHRVRKKHLTHSECSQINMSAQPTFLATDRPRRKCTGQERHTRDAPRMALKYSTALHRRPR